MRIYVGTSMAGLRRLSEDGHLDVGTAHAVTPELREVYEAAGAGTDPEELEFAAAGEAEAAALAQLAADPDLPGRRVVAAVDITGDITGEADADDTEGRTPGAVRVHDRLSESRVAAVLVDDAEAEVLVDQARRVDPDRAAQLLEDVALSWYAPEEIAMVLDEST